jgi:hypothetical protein
MLTQLQAAGRVDPGDFMTFEVQPDVHQPVIHDDGLMYDGVRLRAAGKLGGK